MSEPTADDLAYVMAALAKLGGDLTQLAARLSTAEDRVEDLSSGFDSIEGAVGDGAAVAAATDADDESPGEGADEESAEGIDMRELVTWVRDHVAHLIERKLPQTGTPPFWCRAWWMHAEAIARFEAARRSWAEAVGTGGNAMVVYFEHLDHQLAVLMGEGGPFAGCARGEHRPGAVLALGHAEPDPAYFIEFDQLETS